MLMTSFLNVQTVDPSLPCRQYSDKLFPVLYPKVVSLILAVINQFRQIQDLKGEKNLLSNSQVFHVPAYGY